MKINKRGQQVGDYGACHAKPRQPALNYLR